eukprot:15011107-Alexandrium_andersonii.AAC.1
MTNPHHQRITSVYRVRGVVPSLHKGTGRNPAGARDCRTHHVAISYTLVRNHAVLTHLVASRW